MEKDMLYLNEELKKERDDILIFCLDNSRSMDSHDGGKKSRKELMVMAIDS